MQEHFLRELAKTVEDFSYKNGRKFYLIAESNLNDVRVIQPRESGGYGIDTPWCDESHVFCAMNSHKETIVFHAQLPNRIWKKILDSSDGMWGGSGSSLPGMRGDEQELTIRPHGFALYEAYT